MLAAALLFLAFMYYLVREIKRLNRDKRRRFRPLKVKEHTTKCELCNGEDLYIAGSKMACPKCKGGN